MSVKSKLARQAVKTTAKHTAQGTAARLAHKPLRSVALLALGAALGGIVGWLIGRSGAGEDRPAAAPAPPVSVAGADGSTGQAAATGAVP